MFNHCYKPIIDYIKKRQKENDNKAYNALKDICRLLGIVSAGGEFNRLFYLTNFFAPLIENSNGFYHRIGYVADCKRTAEELAKLMNCPHFEAVSKIKEFMNMLGTLKSSLEDLYEYRSVTNQMILDTLDEKEITDSHTINFKKAIHEFYNEYNKLCELNAQLMEENKSLKRKLQTYNILKQSLEGLKIYVNNLNLSIPDIKENLNDQET